MLLSTAWHDSKKRRNNSTVQYRSNLREKRKLTKTATIKQSQGMHHYHDPAYDTMNKQGKGMSHGGTRGPVVEPQLHFVQAYVLNQMHTVPLHAVDTTVLLPLMTKKEKEESQTHMVDNTSMPQKTTNF